MTRCFPACVVAVCALFFGASADAVVYNADPSDYQTVLGQLVAGDILELAAGDYTDGLSITDMIGADGNPIIITGPTSGAPAVFLGDSSRNTVSIRRSEYVTISHLKIDGLQIAYIDAIKAEGDVDNWAHHITIEYCEITGHDANQQTTGISTKAPAWNWTIRYNIIHSAGTGMYLGNSDGEAAFIAGLIEYNLIADPEGYCMQIKHQNPRPALPDMPDDGATTIIRHNVFIKDDDPSGSGDRPNVLLGHFPLSGEGQNDLYAVYGNFFFHNPREALFQGEGNIHLHDNIFVDSANGWPAVNITAHNDVPRDIAFYNNTICHADTGISVTGVDVTYDQMVVANAVFAADPLSLVTGVVESDNVTDTVSDAAAYVIDATLDLALLDMYPLQGQLTGGSYETTLADLTGDPDYDRDFNGTVKDFTYRGAYNGGESSNPGWHLASEIKDEVAGSDSDADTDSDADSDTDADGTVPTAPVSGRSIDEDGCGCSAPGRVKIYPKTWLSLIMNVCSFSSSMVLIVFPKS